MTDSRVQLAIAGTVLIVIGFALIPAFPLNLPFNLVGGLMVGIAIGRTS